MSFRTIWDSLQSNLRVGVTIPNWTAHKGLLGDSFTVTAVAPKSIDVDTPGAEAIQHIQMGDFEQVYNLWSSYRAGTTPRAEVRDKTRFSKYIISIFRWLEGNSDGPLP